MSKKELLTPTGTKERIFCIPDLHCPYVDKVKVSLMLSYLEVLKPTIVIQMGDIVDFISQSKFPRSIKQYDAITEVKEARDCAVEIWEAVVKRTPKAQRYQILGNHDIRPLKRLIEKAAELEPFVDIKPFFEFHGVTTIHDPRETLEIDDIVFTHGHYTKIGQHMMSFQKSCSVGHVHRAGVHYYRLHDRVLFELWCGYLANPFHEALVYRPIKKYFNWHQGFGFIDRHGARFFPL